MEGIHQSATEEFFGDLSGLFSGLDLPACDIWVAGSYARGEQNAVLKNGRLLSESDLELLVVARAPGAVRKALQRSDKDIRHIINRHFDPSRPLDFGYWAVSPRRFRKTPCVLFADAYLSGKKLHNALNISLPCRLTRSLMRDVREILIHRAVNQLVFGYSQEAGQAWPGSIVTPVVARNILDLLTVYHYAEGRFVATYRERVGLLDRDALTLFGADAPGIFARSLAVKLGEIPAQDLPIAEARRMEEFYIGGLCRLYAHTERLQERKFGEKSLNYSGSRTIAYRLHNLARRPGMPAIQALFCSKPAIFQRLIRCLKGMRNVPDQAGPALQRDCRHLKKMLLADYPYLIRKFGHA